MEHTFWHNKWEINQVGFHLDYVHPLLKRNLELFQVNGVLKNPGKIFIPLCGKTLDIEFLLSQGFEVAAVELSEIAVKEVFNQLKIVPVISSWLGGEVYQYENLTIFVGDYFSLTQKEIGSISFVYDRAALIALPEKMRLEYAQHMAKITQYAPQLLITLDYDQNIASGPPFAVSSQEVEALYGGIYPIQLLEEADIIEEEPRFKAKGLTSFFQRAYKLK
jgi:thiopurine S-methyltransferase